MANKTTITAEEGKQELFINREFDAPRQLVFKAFSDPALLVQWMGNGQSPMVVEKLDSKTHGSWRFVVTDSSGKTYGFNGVIHEALEPERIIRTFEIENAYTPGNVQLEFTTFEELEGGRTKLTIHTLYRSAKDRDTMLKWGMEQGANMAHNRLQELLNTLK